MRESYIVRRITQVCDHGGCREDAKYRVYGPRNGGFGDYCMPHAQAKAENLNRYEQAHDYANSRLPR